MKRKLMLLLACLFVGIGLVTAQNQKVTGTVYSEDDGQPVVGASILVKGTTVGTTTDIDGKFLLNVPSAGKTLKVSYIGMVTQEVAVKPNMKITLKSNAQVTDEVIVVAYGTQKKSSFTGSAGRIDGNKLSLKDPSEVTKALAGEIAGVQVVNASGQPGSNATIRIRGIGSVNSSNAPLYVVDGIPYGGDLSGINPTDIESTTVLKDATAAALYGSRASNGVILITTKNGFKGDTKVEAEVKYGISDRIIPLYSTINSPERFAELTWEGMRNKQQYIQGLTPANAGIYASDNLFNNGKGIDPSYNIWNAEGQNLIDPVTGYIKNGVTRKFTPEKWSDNIFKTGKKFESNIKISGGNEKTTYFVSLGYLKDEGYYISSNFERFNVRSNINNNIYPWLKSSLNMNYSYMTTNDPGQGTNSNNGFQFVNGIPSLYPVFKHDENGAVMTDNVIGGSMYDYGLSLGNGRPYASGINPAGAVQLDKNETIAHQFAGNARVEARFLKDFKFSTTVGLQYYGSQGNELTNPYYGDAKGLGRITKSAGSTVNFTANQILSWTHSYDKHNFDLFVAHEATVNVGNSMTGDKSLILRPDNTEWTNAVIVGYMNSSKKAFAMESFFGQLRYDYNQKYHLNVSLRSDGSSRFSKDSRWGTFGSIGAAWVLSKEDFLKDVKWLTNLKYKVSWGLLGNQSLNTGYSVADYAPFYNYYVISNLNDKPSIAFKFKGNPKLTWEHSSTFNTGVEFGIGKVLDCEFEYFNKRTSDMLFLKQVSPSLGYASYPVNEGQMVNKGVEFNVNAHLVKTQDVKFDFRLNGGTYKNEMTQMPTEPKSGLEKKYEIHGLYAWSKGRSYYDYYLKEYAGVDSETGLALYNQYWNVKADGTKELITDMEKYKSNNAIENFEVKQTTNYDKATKKYIDKTAIPAISGGFGFDFTYKNFELSTTFTYALGGYAYDYVYADLMGDNSVGKKNWSIDIEKRWQKPGDVTDVPRLNAGGDSYTNSSSTRFLTSRSYLNLSSARIGYSFPVSMLAKTGLKKLSLFVSGDNLFLISKRKGFVSMSSVDGSSDSSAYLPLTSFVGGLKIEF